MTVEPSLRERSTLGVMRALGSRRPVTVRWETRSDQERNGPPTGIRTLTGLILSQLPLPLGYGGVHKAARRLRAESTALVYKTL